MRLYEFKRGHRKGIEEIEEIMREIFGKVESKEGRLISSFKGLSRIEVWLQDKKLAVETESREVGEEDAMETLRKWNDFLFRVTGYTSKERKKKMSKS